NPKGSVPALQLDDGEVLTEGPAIVQYLADQVPDQPLAPRAGTFARYRLQEWLNFITSELHKSFSPLFRANTPEDYKPIIRENLGARFDFVEKHLSDGRGYPLGGSFPGAAAYIFVRLRWAPPLGFALARWPKPQAYAARIAARPAVEAALDAEKLKKVA